MSIKISTVETRKDLHDFISAPDGLYKHDPHWIKQLDYERLNHLGNKNPFFRHARHKFFTAKDAKGQLIGRISAQIDDLAQANDHAPIGHFGFLEANSEETLDNLLTQAEKWLSNQGTKKIYGPYSLSVNDEAGLLVNGFDTPPRLLMNHAQPWYQHALETRGYTKAKDLLAYHLNVSADLPPRITRLASEALKIEGITERPINMRDFENDLNVVMKIFNDAWKDNWGFIPMTKDEVSYMADNMKAVIKPEMARIIEVSNEPVAMIVALPDMNEAIQGLNGKLLPLGWAKILWRLKVRGLTQARVLLMGIQKSWRKDLRSGALAALLIQRLHEALTQNKYTDLEMSWILEDNHAMRRIIESGGGKVYKHYRIYEKDIS